LSGKEVQRVARGIEKCAHEDRRRLWRLSA
jgi:hypothetical protein